MVLPVVAWEPMALCCLVCFPTRFASLELLLWCWFVPAYFCMHGLRYAMRTKRELITEMSGFTLDAVECREDFDRQYIHGAIEHWYGSHGAFEAFVRGPLRAELLATQADTQLPIAYELIVIFPFVALGMDVFVGIIQSPLPLEFAVSYFFGSVLGVLLSWSLVTACCALHLGRFFSGGSCTSRLADHGQSLLAFCALLLQISSGLYLGRESYQQSLGHSLAFFFASLVVCWLVHDGWKKMAQLCHRSTGARRDQADEDPAGAENEETARSRSAPEKEETWTV
ncbi:unnamed protein product [Symbiodinium sp. CCMP2592]|nr:unnamed protein product [Symbiodinium sp. CCMP2592]